MKALLWIGGIVLALLLLVGGSYNGMVGGKNKVVREYAVVQTQLQARADLVPNLVATVRGYTNHEERVLVELTEARAQATRMAQIDPSQIAANPDLQRQLLESQSRLIGAITVTVEAYPQLQSAQLFGQLQATLEGTERRIAVARRDAQIAVESYNNSIQKLPGVLFAGLFGFEPFDFYEATAPDAEQVPTVDFSTTP